MLTVSIYESNKFRVLIKARFSKHRNVPLKRFGSRQNKVHFWIQDESHLALIYLIKKNQMLEWNSHVHLPVQVFQLNDEIGENLVQARQF